MDRFQRRRVKKQFNTEWYESQYGVPKRQAFKHYLDQGIREGLRPVPWFDPADYLAANPDITESGLGPFDHYVLYGMGEGRDTRVLIDDPATITDVVLALDPRVEPEANVYQSKHQVKAKPFRSRQRPARPPMELVRQRFDSAYYSSKYAVDEEGAFDTYLEDRQLWTRKPTSWFDGDQYLRMNPDVDSAGVNPFVHYIHAGSREGRQPGSPGSQAFLGSISLEDPFLGMANWSLPQSIVLLAPELAAQYVIDKSTSLDIFVTIGNDDFLAGTGGIQVILSEELLECRRRGVGHVHLFPSAPSPLMGERHPGMSTLVNGESGPDLALTDLRAFLDALTAKGAMVLGIRIHGLLGIDSAKMARALVGMQTCEFIVHDMSTVCTNYGLTFDGLDPCGAPPVSSAACRLCAFGNSRQDLIPDVAQFLTELNPVIVFPSESAREMWNRVQRPQTKQVVRAHGHLNFNSTRIVEARKPRLAFMGMSTPSKGFSLFTDLADWNLAEQVYELFWLGRARDNIPGIVNVEVDQVGGHSGLMTQAVIELGIHAAIVAPRGFETFSFVAHEAVAGGALILTHRKTGNVAALAQDNGFVSENSKALLRLIMNRRFADSLTRLGRERPIGHFDFAIDIPEGRHE